MRRALCLLWAVGSAQCAEGEVSAHCPLPTAHCPHTLLRFGSDKPVQYVEEIPNALLGTVMTDLRDPIQFNDAYRRLAPLALASANRVLRDEAAAEDVVQDVFMQLWLKPSLFDPSRGSLTSFVSMLARSRALHRWRSKAAREHAVERSAEQSRVLV